MTPQIPVSAVAARRPRRALAELSRFCLVGASGYVVNLVAFAGLHSLGAHHVLAAAGAFLLAVGNNFHFNRRFTFRHGGSAARFLLVSVAAFVIGLAVLDALIAAGVAPLAAQAVAIVAVTPLSFVANRRWSFADPGSSNAHRAD